MSSLTIRGPVLDGGMTAALLLAKYYFTEQWRHVVVFDSQWRCGPPRLKQLGIEEGDFIVTKEIQTQAAAMTFVRESMVQATSQMLFIFDGGLLSANAIVTLPRLYPTALFMFAGGED